MFIKRYFKTRRKKPKKKFSDIFEDLNIIEAIIKFIIIIVTLIIFICMPVKNKKPEENQKLKVALCTMGRNENLYIHRFQYTLILAFIFLQGFCHNVITI